MDLHNILIPLYEADVKKLRTILKRRRFEFAHSSLSRSVQKLESSVSCRIPVVVAQQSTQPLAAIHLPFLHRSELRLGRPPLTPACRPVAAP